LSHKAGRAVVVVLFVAIGVIFLIAYQASSGGDQASVTRFATLLIVRTVVVFGLLWLGLRATAGRGWNWRAVAATLVGCAFAWIGVFVPRLKPLYDYAWFVGFGASALTYFILTTISPPQNLSTETT
jgi:hypothetical protein